MTRVWSLSSTNETQESQLLIIWKHESNLLSFDSGYQSSISHSLNDVTEEFDNHFNDFEELEDYSHVNEENRYQESSQQVTHVLHSRVQSSPIPIPQTSRHHKSSINHSSSSLSSHSDHSFTSSEQSLHSIDSVHCLIGHPPYDCGCIRGYRYPFMATNVTQQTQSSLQTDNLLPRLSCSRNQRESADNDVKKQWYPLPDIVSSSQNTTLMNEIIREIGSDLRRISKDFITTRDQNIESPMISAVTRLIRIAIPLILKEVIQLF